MEKYYQDLNELKKEDIKFTRDDIFDDIEEIEIAGNFFVLTGTFTSGKRKDIEDLIKQYGGKVQKKIAKTTDYLVVGEITTRDWKYGNYGTKIEKALEWKNQTLLKIIPEQVLIKSIKGKETPHSEIEDEIFNIFLNMKQKSKYKLSKQTIYQEEDDELSKELGIDVYTTYETYETEKEFILKKLKLNNILSPAYYISEIKTAYDNLSENEKKELTPIIKEQLEKLLKNSLRAHFKKIKYDIENAKKHITKLNKLEKGVFNLKESFDEFANTKFVKKQIDKFYNEMLKEIEKSILQEERR